jgi:hypothetical protein
MPRSHLLKGKDDLSERLSFIQVLTPPNPVRIIELGAGSAVPLQPQALRDRGRLEQSQSPCDSSHAGGATAQIITPLEISTGECFALGFNAEFVRKRDYALLANFP